MSVNKYMHVLFACMSVTLSIALHECKYACTPIFPARWMCPGIIPILHAPGLITPGQLGPVSIYLLRYHNSIYVINDYIRDDNLRESF